MVPSQNKSICQKCFTTRSLIQGTFFFALKSQSGCMFTPTGLAKNVHIIRRGYMDLNKIQNPDDQPK